MPIESPNIFKKLRTNFPLKQFIRQRPHPAIVLFLLLSLFAVSALLLNLVKLTRASPTVLWEDNFTGDNGAPPDETKWEEFKNDNVTSRSKYDIFENKLRATVGSKNGNWAIIQLRGQSQADFGQKSKIIRFDTTAWSNNKNRIYLYLAPTIASKSVFAENNWLRVEFFGGETLLEQRVDGVTQRLGKYLNGFGDPSDTLHSYILEIEGPNVRLFEDGVEKINSAHQLNFTSFYPYLATVTKEKNEKAHYYDNVSIEELATGVVTLFLTHGPVVGRVTSNSATVFVRIDKSATVKIAYSQDPALAGAVESAPVQTTEEKDFTVKIELSSLNASSVYYYDVLVDEKPQLTPPYPTFKTFPTEGENVDFTVTKLTDFCCFPKFTYQPQATNTFANASNEQSDLVIIGGDFDHRNPEGAGETDARDQKRQMFKDLYTPVTNMEDFVDKILRQYPVAHMWDDHDYAKNNADKTYPYKHISLEVLNEYFPTYDTTQHGDWQKFRLAQAEFFLLDSRGQRDNHNDPNGPDKSMLDGDNLGTTGQLEWLKTGLLNSTARWKFILSPVVFNPTMTKPDSWSGYPDEQNSLLEFINTSGIKNVIVISGDLHAGGIDNGTNAGLPEMLVPSANLSRGTNVSCLSYEGGTIGTWSESSYGDNSGDPCQGYGLIKVLTNPDRVILQVKDDQGNVKISYTLQSQP